MRSRRYGIACFATVVTPNLYEVAQLTDVKVEDETGMRIRGAGAAGVRLALGIGEGVTYQATRWTC